MTSCEFVDHEAMSRHAAALVTEEVRRQPGLLLCTAAGSTPTRTYEMLAATAKAEPRLFDALRVLKLDEWGGLEPSHPATCESYLREYLIGRLKVPSERYIAFRSDAAIPQAECERIQAALEQHLPIDYCILGLGANGHLGLNEPGESLKPFAHVADLAESTLEHPMLGSAKGGVHYGLTLGMAEIMQSTRILLLVSGAHKRKPLRRLLRREVSSRFPASFLWLHPDTTLLYDRNASGSSGEVALQPS